MYPIPYNTRSTQSMLAAVMISRFGVFCALIAILIGCGTAPVGRWVLRDRATGARYGGAISANADEQPTASVDVAGVVYRGKINASQGDAAITLVGTGGD